MEDGHQSSVRAVGDCDYHIAALRRSLPVLDPASRAHYALLADDLEALERKLWRAR